MPSPETPPVHGGDVVRAAASVGHAPEAVLDVSANLHPWGPPPGALDAARAAVASSPRYPSPRGEPLRERLSARIGAEVVLGNGASELLFAAVSGARRVLVQAPSYLGYYEAAAATGAQVVHAGVPEAGDVVVVGRPNNPDGRLPSVAEIRQLANTHPDVRIVVDESFLAFTSEPSAVGVAPNVVVVTSLTKTFAIPGLRLGWAAGLPASRIPPWTVNAPALAAGLACLDAWDWPRRIPLDAWRSALADDLRALPTVAEVAGAANFLLITLHRPSGPALRDHALRHHRVLVRDASNHAGLDARHLRVAVRLPEENRRVVEALS